MAASLFLPLTLPPRPSLLNGSIDMSLSYVTFNLWPTIDASVLTLDP